MGKKFLVTVLALALLAAGAMLASATVYLVQSEILPAMAAGSLSVKADSMILNRVWHGNEIYLLLALYIIAAPAMAGAGIILLRRIFSPGRPGPGRNDKT